MLVAGWILIALGNVATWVALGITSDPASTFNTVPLSLGGVGMAVFGLIMVMLD
jgi:hypothetical protein